jgi:stage II sporulation protein D
MKSFKRILTAFIFVFLGCTPTSVDRSEPIKERIISEMSIKKEQVLPEEAEKELKISGKNFVRVGIIENESNILFSFSGMFSIYSGEKIIFTKKRSSGSWKVTTKGNETILENIETGEKIDVNKALIFKPEQISCYVRIGKIQSGKGWHWEETKSRSYKGNIEFININGKITVVNEVGIEQYLYGVVPSEMSAQSPVEALKAQAILARTNIYSKIGKKYKDKPYSLSSDVYSQVYTGIDNITERASRAVDDTRGMVLTFNGKPLEAFFHSVCGGHLESNEIIWGGEHLPYLEPKPCGDSKSFNYGDLSKETNFKKWIDSKPESYCNIENKNLEPGLDFAKKYHRWELKVDRKKMENIIKSTTGTDIGDMKDITVLGRGESGKAKSVKITGSKTSITINKELNIRKQLGRPPLYSANFYVEKIKTGKNGLAESFVFKGAGFGHGTGMCQIGACGMASEGKNFIEILNFYFPGSKITEIDK